jgi:hypothetical protein
MPVKNSGLYIASIFSIDFWQEDNLLHGIVGPQTIPQPGFATTLLMHVCLTHTYGCMCVCPSPRCYAVKSIEDNHD